MNTKTGWNAIYGSFVLLALLAALVPVTAHAQIQQVTLVNQTNITFRELHVSSTADGYWERDLLGRNYFPPGYEFTVEMRRGYWDLKLTDMSGSNCIIPRIPVDHNAVVAVTDEWLEQYCTFQISRR
jgi:hypothetical protein